MFKNSSLPHPHLFWALMFKTPFLPNPRPFWVPMSQKQILHPFHPFWVLTYLHPPYPSPPFHNLKSIININKGTHPCTPSNIHPPLFLPLTLQTISLHAPIRLLLEAIWM